MESTEKDKKQRQDFFDIFKEVESYLREESGIQNGGGLGEITRTIIKNRKQSAYILSEYKDELNLFSEWRNNYSHQNSQNYIPSEGAIEIFKKIRNKLIKPKTIYEFIKDENKNTVFTCDVKDKLKNVLSIMQEKTYTHIPVTANGKFIGLLSESSICERIGNNLGQDGTIIIENTLVEDSNVNSKNDHYLIVSRSTPLHVILETFNEYINKGERLGAIFITNLGKKDEKLDGIITAWDIPTVKKYL